MPELLLPACGPIALFSQVTAGVHFWTLWQEWYMTISR